MPITETQRLERKKHLGSSDLAAVMGLDPWRNAADVYLDKTGQLTEWPGNKATDLGNRLEPVVLAMAAEELGSLIVPDTKIVASCPVIAANTDSLVEASGEPVEAKTHSIAGPGSDEWGQEGTDEVPLRVIIQATVHEMAWDREVCHIPSLIGRRGFVMYRVNRNADVVKAIEDAAAAFWDRVVKGEPPDVAPHLEIAKRMRRTPERVVDLDPAIVQGWRDAVAAEKVADEAKEAATAALLAALGTAEAGTAGALGAVTYLSQTRKEHIVKASTFRALRFKPKGL